jgi:AcrR family transcriptional regulator
MRHHSQHMAHIRIKKMPAEKLSPKRLAPERRREQIIDAAIKHFAEVGFEGGTRGVAERLGVTQPLIYRYFPSKDDLIRAVYDQIYLNRWQTEWIDLLKDREVQLRQRIIEFYRRYTEVVFAPDWIRIHIFSGLHSFSQRGWWLHFVEDQVLTTVCAEIRHAYDFPDVRALPIQHSEIEAYWLFHGGVFFYGMRREVYGAAPSVELSRVIENGVDGLLAGYPILLRKLLATAKSDIKAKKKSLRQTLK